MKGIAKFLLWLGGWKLDPNIPPESQRCVMVAAPHTSNWDFYYVRLAFWALGIPMKVAIKNDWTNPPFGWVIKPMGGIGVNRGPKKGTQRKSQVDAMAALFTTRDRIAMVIAPEGTRQLNPRWKMGYYWIASTAKVPITMGYLDYKRKVAGVSPIVIHPTGDPKKDLPQMMNFYKSINGFAPDQFQVDERYTST
ncbi:MAG: 1-acyl-sn-glycerol-3-phosphate acyltransferase [Bacteroidota bacterium]